jgi:hypothetical protein
VREIGLQLSISSFLQRHFRMLSPHPPPNPIISLPLHAVRYTGLHQFECPDRAYPATSDTSEEQGSENYSTLVTTH